jgi:hypothetical protein
MSDTDGMDLPLYLGKAVLLQRKKEMKRKAQITGKVRRKLHTFPLNPSGAQPSDSKAG